MLKLVLSQTSKRRKQIQICRSSLL